MNITLPDKADQVSTAVSKSTSNYFSCIQKTGARSTQQAIAIGLSKARKAGVQLPPYGRKKHTDKKRRNQIGPSKRRSRAISNVLKREPKTVASPQALAAQAHHVAQRRGPEARRRSAIKAIETKGPRLLKEEARKAARSRKAG